MPLAPPYPSGLNFTFNSTNQVVLTWYAVAGATGYNVYKTNNPLSVIGSPINNVPIVGLTFTDINFSGLADTYYYVTWINGAGVESLPSSAAYIPLSVGSSYVMPRVDFWQPAFDKFILEHGYDVIWEQAISCPCNKSTQSTTDAGDLDCNLCGNKHYIWVNPTAIRCAMQSMTRNSDLKEDGIYQAGAYKVTTHSSNKVGFYDRLTFEDTSAPLSETIQKGAANGADSVRFPASSIVLPIIDRSGIYYYVNKDFTVNASGQIQWGVAGGKQPTTGVFYGVTYFTQWRMLFVEYPHDIRAESIQLGTPTPVFTEFCRQGVAKLEWFFGI